MERSILEQWAKLYHFTREISALEPWERLSEADALVYEQKGTGKELVFSILGNECPFCGIACYPSWTAFSKLACGLPARTFDRSRCSCCKTP